MKTYCLDVWQPSADTVIIYGKHVADSASNHPETVVSTLCVVSFTVLYVLSAARLDSIVH